MRQERKRRLRNRMQRSRLKTAVKKAQSAETDAAEVVKETSALLDRLATRRIIHPNKAARKKSQLARHLNKLKG
jgi:small subunit ribosomal protein S20